MCVRCDESGEPLAVVAKGVDAADAILAQSFGLRVEKADGIATPRGFERAVARLAGLLHARALPVQQEATRAVTAALDLDWRELGPHQRSRAVEEAAKAARKITADIPLRLRSVLGRAAVDVVQSVRTAMRDRQGLALGVDFNAVDRRVVEHVVRSQSNFVRDDFGRRTAQFSARAREVVADGLERGLGRGEISASLEEAARGVILGKSPFYWDVVASAFTSNARSYAQMSSYAEAGIERYQIVAVLDAHTTPLCRYLNGRTFSVAKALDRFDAIDALESPEDIKSAQPWGREVRNPNTGLIDIYVQQGDVRTTLASYAPDTPSRFVGRADDAVLENSVSWPPYHGLCRSGTVAATT